MSTFSLVLRHSAQVTCLRLYWIFSFSSLNSASRFSLLHMYHLSKLLCSCPWGSVGDWFQDARTHILQLLKFLGGPFVFVYTEPTDIEGQLYLIFTPYNSASQGLKVSFTHYISITYCYAFIKGQICKSKHCTNWDQFRESISMTDTTTQSPQKVRRRSTHHPPGFEFRACHRRSTYPEKQVCLVCLGLLSVTSTNFCKSWFPEA